MRCGIDYLKSVSSTSGHTPSLTELYLPLIDDYDCCCRSALILYRQILDGIEKNGYNNFTQRAYVPKWKKFLSLPRAVMAAKKSSSHSQASQPSPFKMS